MSNGFSVSKGVSGRQKLMSTIQKYKKTRSLAAEKLATKVASMSRSQLKGKLLTLKTRFPMDFTQEYLDSLSSEKLRHILLAAQLNGK